MKHDPAEHREHVSGPSRCTSGDMSTLTHFIMVFGFIEILPEENKFVRKSVR